MQRADDPYCSVSGIPWLFSPCLFFNCLSSLGCDSNEFLLRNREANLNNEEFKVKHKVKHQTFFDGLRKFHEDLFYSEEDVESSSRFVLVCPFEIMENGTIKYSEWNDPPPTKYTESTITTVFNIFPGDDWNYGDYEDIDGQLFYMLRRRTNLLVSYASYVILKQAAPDVKPHILYALTYGGNQDTMGRVAGINYGPVCRAFRRYHSDLPAVCEGGSENSVTFWRRLLSDKERADEDILHDAWRGPGNMWVFVRPDRFPIAETIAATPLPNFPCPINTELTLQSSRPTLICLPSDILLSVCEFLPIRSIYALITTCRSFRSVILPHANSIARRRLIEDEPWYLPSGPLELNLMNPKSKQARVETNGRKARKGRQAVHGREEIEWWAEQWATGGISQEANIPWFVYRKECSKSMSMWSRKRIWGIAKQLDALARLKGLL